MARSHEQRQPDNRQEPFVDVQAEVRRLAAGLYMGGENTVPDATEEIPVARSADPFLSNGRSTQGQAYDQTASTQDWREAPVQEDVSRMLRDRLYQGSSSGRASESRDARAALEARLRALQSLQEQSYRPAVPPAYGWHESQSRRPMYAPEDYSGQAEYPQGGHYDRATGRASGPMPSGYSPNGQYEDRRDDATSSRDTETELTTTYSRVGEATVPQNAEPTPQTEEQSKRQRRNPFQYVKEWPRPAKIGAIVGLAALAVPGGLYARHHSEDVKRDNMIAAESTKFAGGLMPDFLNCRDPKSALTLDMAADTASGLKLNIKFMNAKTGKEVLGYMPKEAHMVGRMAIGLCVAGDAAGNSKPKPLAQYVDGQIQVDRSVVKLASLEKLDIPPCDLVLAEGKPWSCAVALFPPSYPIVDGKELTAESGLTTTYKIINDAEKSRALSLAKVPEGANKTLTAEQRQALLVANVAMFKELIDNADKSCVSDFDAQLAKEVLPELKKKFNALPQNQQLKFVGSYGPIAQGLTDTKTISDVLNTKIATADGLEMHCSVSTGEPQTAAPSQPANSPPPTPSPTQTSQPKTTTNGAKP